MVQGLGQSMRNLDQRGGRGGRRRGTSARVLRALATALRKEAKKSEPRTAAAVAGEHGVSKQMVYVRFPELVEEILVVRGVLDRTDDLFDKAAVIIVKEIRSSAPRSLDEVAREVGISRMGLSKRFPELRDGLTQARRQVRVRPRTTVVTRVSKDSYLAVLRTEIASPNPRSVADVARSLGASARRLRRARAWCRARARRGSPGKFASSAPCSSSTDQEGSAARTQFGCRTAGDRGRPRTRDPSLACAAFGPRSCAGCNRQAARSRR